jgi:SAM-dependent methyltransferase
MQHLMLCHGRDHDIKSDSLCYTSFRNKKAVYLDKDPTAKPDILHDWTKPIKFKNKFDIITTMCCDGNVFYDNNKVVKQTFKNIKQALKPDGIFVLPKYIWLSQEVIEKIPMKLITSFKNRHETYYIFS